MESKARVGDLMLNEQCQKVSSTDIMYMFLTGSGSLVGRMLHGNQVRTARSFEHWASLTGSETTVHTFS